MYILLFSPSVQYLLATDINYYGPKSMCTINILISSKSYLKLMLAHRQRVQACRRLNK